MNAWHGIKQNKTKKCRTHWIMEIYFHQIWLKSSGILWIPLKGELILPAVLRDCCCQTVIKWNVFGFQCIKSITIYNSFCLSHTEAHMRLVRVKGRWYGLGFLFHSRGKIYVYICCWSNAYLPKFILKFYYYYHYHETPECFNPYGSIIIVSNFHAC